MKGSPKAAASVFSGSWLPIMLELEADGTGLAVEKGWRVKEVEDSCLNLLLALLWSGTAVSIPVSRAQVRRAGYALTWSSQASPWGKRRFRGVPGESQAEAWGKLGSGGVGNEGQLLPRDSAFHSPPAAPGRAQALPPKGAPGRLLGAGSSRCSRLDHLGPAWHLPRDWIAEVTALPQLEPPGTFVPVDASLRFSEIRWDPGPERLPFPLDSSVVLAPPSKSSKRIAPHTNSPPSYQIA